MSKVIVVQEEGLIGRLDQLCKVYFGSCDERIADIIIDMNPQIDFFNDGLSLGDMVNIPSRVELLDIL